ncbi:hypothetical protein CHARACLAT_025048 [Characodon lateralis]|uniref:Secreted protein n=1 Tax=Characodon lateralis TaxID=208331 RepID=A0ABU7DJM4_9TELE|nr:hypothetical protein [Characodon lateralis]
MTGSFTCAIVILICLVMMRVLCFSSKVVVRRGCGDVSVGVWVDDRLFWCDGLFAATRLSFGRGDFKSAGFHISFYQKAKTLWCDISAFLTSCYTQHPPTFAR